MRTRAETAWLAIGAVIGGIIVGTFPTDPRWLWSLIGGVSGGALGLAAAYLAGLKRPWPIRLIAIAAVLIVGFGALFLVVGGRWVTDPRNFNVGSQ
jgi:uncharacterized membrane protein (UPF0136 family)